MKPILVLITLLIFSLILPIAQVFATDCDPTVMMGLKQKIMLIVNTVNFLVSSCYNCQISDLHKQVLDSNPDLKNETDSFVACGGDLNSLPVRFTQQSLQVINYQPIPEFGSLAGIIMSISIIGVVIISRRFSFHFS